MSPTDSYTASVYLSHTYCSTSYTDSIKIRSNWLGWLRMSPQHYISRWALPPTRLRSSRSIMRNAAYMGLENRTDSLLLVSRTRRKQFVRGYIHFVFWEGERNLKCCIGPQPINSPEADVLQMEWIGVLTGQVWLAAIVWLHYCALSWFNPYSSDSQLAPESIAHHTPSLR